jgi:predicted metal-binding membrane protein
MSARAPARTTSVDVRGPVLVATLGLAAACWVVAVRRMHGMDMGGETELGPLASFMATWVVMMAAMMLPAAAPAVLGRVRDDGRLAAAPLFVGSYLAVWALAGLAVVVLYRPHGTLGSSAGLTVVLLALGAMSVTWMAVVAAVVLAQRLLPPARLIDGPLALAIVAVGVVHTM